MPLTTPGKSSTDSLTKRVLIRWGNSTQPQHSDEQPDNQHKPPWLRLTAAVVCLSRGISFDPEPNDLNFQSFRVWVTLLYQWQPYLQAWDPLRVRLNWVEVSENIPSKALFILVLDIQDCLLLCNLTREFDVRQSTQCFVPVEMYFEWSYSLKPPVTPFLVITLKLFQNRVPRRLPLRQSFEVSGHLRSGHLWAGSGHLWAGLIRLHCLSSSFKRVHLGLHLTVVSRDLKTSGLTSSVNSLGPCLDYPRFLVALQTFPTRELQIEEVVCTSLRSPSTCFSLLILSEKAFAD